jgi:probable HAF family extracellular repeat protein
VVRCAATTPAAIKHPWFGLLAAVAFVVAPSRVQAQLYSVTELGTLGGTASTASGMSKTGSVVGSSTVAGDATSDAFIYANGTMIDLGTLGGSYGLADGANSSGAVVGYSYPAGNLQIDPFVYSNGTMTDLGTLGGVGGFSVAKAINDAGTIVGDSVTPAGAPHAFIYSGGVMTDMGTLGGTMAYVHGINSSGTIIGDSTLAGDVLLDAFVYSNGTMTDLNAPGRTANYGVARAINDSGTIVGSSTVIASGYAHAFSYSNGTFTDLGTLGGTMASAVAINSSGTIVGSSSLRGDRQTDSFVYSGGQMSDLNTLLLSPSVALSGVLGIGDLGQIAGNGTDQANGYSGALLLTPISVHLSVVVDGPTSVGAGYAVAVTVTALDANGNIVTGYGRTIQLTSSDGAADLPAGGTLTAGTGTFMVTLNTTGAQTVTATDEGLGSINASVSVTVVPSLAPSTAGRIVNLSARAGVGTGGNVLIAGFVINGSGAKSVLLRGIGPTLALDPFDITGALANPQLTLVDSATGADLVTATAWGGSPALSSEFTQVGAFPLAGSSADSATLRTLPVGNYTSLVSGVNSNTGVALAEIYDADVTSTQSSLTNMSARAEVGIGANILIAGFVVEGSKPVKVLLRGVGPTLGLEPYNVPGVLAQPQVLLFNSSGQELGGGVPWGGYPALSVAFAEVGAFALAPGSADVAMIFTLPAGSYTAQLSGQNGTTGVGLLEVYLMPQ